ncbi:MAG: serine/threonine-protein kinase [Anaerolineae bacterium]
MLGKYQILEPLGRGGMARVYRAYHPHLERYVAIKVLRTALADDVTFLARFQREARAVAALRHPNIVQVFDFDVEGELTYMVMEMLEGDTLKTRLNDYRLRGEYMQEGEIARILLDVLNGLAYAHSRGMIHRDIKPANILLTRQGDAVLADFGIAQIMDGTRYTVEGALMGTPEYMAPEQGLENHSDARSDLYSLGVIVYEMLTGRTPFTAETPLAVLMQHLNTPPPSPRSVAPHIPEPFERLVLKALAKDPDDRYQSAGEMRSAVQLVVQALQITLPKMLSPPLSFATEELPSDSVAIFSGEVRERLTEVDFAAQETDASLGQRLEKGERRSPTASARGERVGQALMAALLLILFGNLMMLAMGGLSGNWGAFERGWPMELWLLGSALALIMAQVESIWLLLPTTLVMGNALLMSYCTLTGKWNQWIFLWVLEVLIVATAIFVPLRLAKQSENAQKVSHSLGTLLAVVGAGFTFLMALLGMVVHLWHQWFGGG